MAGTRKKSGRKKSSGEVTRRDHGGKGRDSSAGRSIERVPKPGIRDTVQPPGSKGGGGKPK